MRLIGSRLLIVEDEYLLASDLAEALVAQGAEVVGPAASVGEALDMVEKQGDRIDGAVLDINLRNERVYPVADELSKRGVPFAFTTGYDKVIIPESYKSTPRFEKPVDQMQIVRWLADNFPAI